MPPPPTPNHPTTPTASTAQLPALAQLVAMGVAIPLLGMGAAQSLGIVASIAARGYIGGNVRRRCVRGGPREALGRLPGF